MVMVGNGVVPDGYRWLPLVMNGFDLLGLLRDGCKKSKWKFKMDFSMKGGGCLEFHIPIQKYDFFKKII